MSRTACLVLAGLLAAACASATEENPAPPPSARRNGDLEVLEASRARGIAEAEQAIAAGEARILYIGLPIPNEVWLDSQTGLLRATCGCEVTLPLVAYVRSWNETTQTAWREGRIRTGAGGRAARAVPR